MILIDLNSQLIGANKYKAKKGFTVTLLQACIYIFFVEEIINCPNEINWLDIELKTVSEDTHIPIHDLLETLHIFERNKLIKSLSINGGFRTQKASFQLRIFKNKVI